LGRRAKSMNGQNIELGVFAALRNDGRSWRATMKEWNEANPSRRFHDSKRFARDCALSYERITGRKLVWQSRKSKGESPVSSSATGANRAEKDTSSTGITIHHGRNTQEEP